MDEYNKADVSEKFAENMMKWPQSVADSIMNYAFEQGYVRRCQGDQYMLELMLDAGCASGASTRPFTSYFQSVVGFDINENQISKAKELGGASNVIYVVAPGEKIPADDNSVDMLTNAFAVQYMDLDKYISECRRVLKHDGCAVIYGCDYSGLKLDGKLAGPVNRDADGIQLLYDHYIRPLEAYLIKIGHPDQHAFNRFAPIYNGIKGMRKARKDDLTFEWKCTLKGFRLMFLSVPIFQQFQDTFKGTNRNPLSEFSHELKKLWGVTGLPDDQIPISLTVSVFAIFLRK